MPANTHKGIFSTRGPVVRLDRSRKASMIEVFLQEALQNRVSGYHILDIGCGNGMISEHFASENEVVGVDVNDQRKTTNSNFHFQHVSSAKLPFDDDSFDIALSHHVIEHIPEQETHLLEMHRILRTNGIGYLGTPNRSSPIMEGHVGNDLVLRYHEMKPLFERCGFNVELLSVRLAANPDRYFGEVRFGRFLPSYVLRFLLPIFPSQYFLLRKT